MTLHLTTPGTTNPASRLFVRGLAVTAATALLVAGSALSATAATSTASTVGNVAVSSTIALTGLTPSFTLSGIVGATVATTVPVTMNVLTNNLLGYSVTVQAATATLTPPVRTIVNPDSIPIGALSVQETSTTGYTPLSSTAAVTVHTQATRSAAAGDTISNDYQVVIPFVNQDTYSVTLNYIAATL